MTRQAIVELFNKWRDPLENIIHNSRGLAHGGDIAHDDQTNNQKRPKKIVSKPFSMTND